MSRLSYWVVGPVLSAALVSSLAGCAPGGAVTTQDPAPAIEREKVIPQSISSVEFEKSKGKDVNILGFWISGNGSAKRLNLAVSTDSCSGPLLWDLENMSPGGSAFSRVSVTVREQHKRRVDDCEGGSRMRILEIKHRDAIGLAYFGGGGSGLIDSHDGVKIVPYQQTYTRDPQFERLEGR